MKYVRNLLFYILVVSGSTGLFAQALYTPGGTVGSSTNGYVGIGTASPLFTLSTTNWGTIATSVLRLQNSYLDNNAYYGVQLAGVDNGINGHDFKIQGRTSSTGPFSDLVIFKNNGNVGIGTTGPAAKLDVQNGYILAEGGLISSNRSAVGLEFNKLFNATSRFIVIQSGGGSTLNLAGLFDGTEAQNYFAADPGIVPSASNPYVITISGLPDVHIQNGAWIGWTSRYNTVSSSFKIEGWDNYSAKNWVTLADVDDSTDNCGHGYNEYMVKVPGGSYTSLRITFRNSESASYFGLSELFFIHPEATRPFEGLLPSSMWEGDSGNVGIGTTNPTEKLSVNGRVRAKEVIVDTNWSDYVFDDNYKLAPLAEIEQHIKTNKHLPGVPSAQEVADKGVSVGDMQAVLLAKIEELTLHVIAQEKELGALRTKVSNLEAENAMLTP